MKKRLLTALAVLLFSFQALAATPHYSFVLPTVGGNQNTWGTLVNTIFNSIDTDLWNAAGGLSTAVNAPAASSSNITLTNPLSNIQNIAFSNTSLDLILPVMNVTASMLPGGVLVVTNVGSNAFSIIAQDGTTSIVSSLMAGQSIFLVLTSGATANGTWTTLGPYLVTVGNISLGTSTSATSPSILGDTTTGFYTSAAAKVDVAISGTKVSEWATTGLSVSGDTTSNSFTPAGTSVPVNGLYLPTSNTPAIASNTQLAAEFVSNGTTANYPVFSSNTTGNAVLFSAAGSDTNIPITIASKGTSGVAIKGASDGSSACSGCVGEYISSSISLGSAISLTNNIPLDITSISLTAGVWNVWGTVGFSPGTGALNGYSGWTSVVSATGPTPPNNGSYIQQSGFSIGGAGNYTIYPTGMMTLNLSSTTTVYVSTQAALSGGTYSAFGFIGAERIR